MYTPVAIFIKPYYKQHLSHFFRGNLSNGLLVRRYQEKSVLTYYFVRCGTFPFNSYY